MESTSAPSCTRIESSACAHALEVSKVYPGGARALRGVSLEIVKGQITGLIGANGSGKATLLKILAGLTAPSSGSVEVLGLDPIVHRRKLARSMSYVSQDVALDPEMTGAETLSLFASLYGVRSEHASALASRFDLDEHLRRQV